MEGLRQRARAAFPGGLSFNNFSREVEVAEILKCPSQSPNYTEKKLPCQKLIGEIRDSALNRTLKQPTQQNPDFTLLQLITIGIEVPQPDELTSTTEMPPGILTDLPQGDSIGLFDACELEPYFLYLISQNANGYQHFTYQSPAFRKGPVHSFYVCSPWLTAVWSFNVFTRLITAIVFLPRKPFTTGRNVTSRRSATNIELVTFQKITEILMEQQDLVDHALFMHMVFSTEMVTCLFDVLRDVSHRMSQLEIIIGESQESQAVGGLPRLGNFDTMPQLWNLVRMSKAIGFFTSDMAIIARQNDVALELLSTSAKTRGIGQLDDARASESMVPSPDQAAEDDLDQAIRLLHRQVAAQKKSIQQLQQRVNNQSSLVRKSRILTCNVTLTLTTTTQISSLINQNMAITTQSDSTAMKTIAVMTMFFLPATFFATLFAVPTLQWTDEQVVSNRFWIYWAFTLPCTAFVILVYKYWQKLLLWARLYKEKMMNMDEKVSAELESILERLTSDSMATRELEDL